MMTAEIVLFCFPFVFNLNVNLDVSEPDRALIILITSFMMLIE